MWKARAWSIGLAVLLTVCGTACNKNKKAEHLAALDSGYQSGLLTKEEYEARRAAVLANAAPPAAASGPAAPASPASTGPAPVVSEPATVAPATPAPATPSPVAPAPVTPVPLAPAGATNPSVEPAPTPASLPGRPGARARSAPATSARNATDPGTPKPRPVQPGAAQGRSADEDTPEPAPLAGCQDAGTKPGKEKGKQERFFPMPVAVVKDAAIRALTALEFKVNQDSGREIEASRKHHVGVLIGSGGERMLLRFEEAEEGHQRGTRVIGETKKGFLMRASQKSWTNAVLAQTGCMLRKGGASAGGKAKRPSGR
ncbi:MAG: hypothetical protein LAQ69_40410 [Acidobacteriia bacterium]|nr:hypothetical protein [Terriglobia bacterium]